MGCLAGSASGFPALDTSGSMDGPHLAQFTGEVPGVLGAYPHIQAELYYAAQDLYGPYDVTADCQLPPLRLLDDEAP